MTSLQHSVFYRWLTAPPAYLNSDTARSRVGVRHLARALDARLQRSAAILGRAWTVSSIRRVLQSPPFAESLAVHLVRERAGVAVILWPLVAYVVIDYVLRRSPAAGSFSALWDELLLLMALAACLGKSLWQGRICWRPTLLAVPVLVYASVMVFIWGLRSPDTAVAVEGVRVYLQYILWFFVTINLTDRASQIRILSTGMIMVAALLAAHGLYQYVTGAPMPAHWVDVAEQSLRTRAYSLVNSPNVLGSFLVLTIPQVLGHLLTSRGRLQRWFLAVVLGIALAGLVVTFSRGALFATCLALVLFGLLTRPVILLPVVAAAAMLPSISSSVRARLAYLLSSDYLASSQRAGRLARWEAALARIKTSPLVGEGPGRFGGAVAARHVPGSFYVDNFYLKTAAETGLLGLAAYLWLLSCLLRGGMAICRGLEAESRILAAGFLSGLVGVLGHNLVENIFEVPAMASYFWLTAGLLFALPFARDR